jgi:ActR/RegA family two-component response regulator
MSTLVRRVSIPLGPAWQPCSAPPSVLLVTEDAGFRSVVGRVLEHAGYSVLAASHSGHAILASLQQSFDVLVIEQRLTEGSSRTIADRIQRYHPDLAIVRLCGAASAAVGGVNLVRPFTADDLLTALRSLVRTPAASRP